jgi:hypothetical protein
MIKESILLYFSVTVVVRNKVQDYVAKVHQQMGVTNMVQLQNTL